MELLRLVMDVLYDMEASPSVPGTREQHAV